ncbi:MAG: CcdB family protein [Pseudomonadota bacterium]
MARFDVYQYDSAFAPLVVDVQADLLNDLSTRVIIPLIPFDKIKTKPLPRLTPIIEIHDNNYSLMTTDLAALPLKQLRKKVCNIEDDYRDVISGALDLLFIGF